MTDDFNAAAIPGTPRPRGRPRRAPEQAASAPDVAAAAAIEAKSLPGRRRRASVGGHSLKLSAPPREGYVRRWFNDDGNRIADAQELAYEHVLEQGIKTTDAGGRVSRLVGTKANGEPLRAYLMETPVDEYAAGLSDKEAQHRQVDEAIAAGRDSTGQMSGEQTYGQGSISRDR